MARDIVLIGVFVFAIAIGLFVLFFSTKTITTSMLEIDVVNDSAPTRTALTDMDNTLAKFDYFVFGTFIAMAIALIITSWFIGGVPIFAFIYFIVIILGVVLSAVLANVWDEITSASVFGTTIASFPITSKLVPYLPWYVAAVGFIGLVVMFGKPYFQNE